MIRFHTTQDVHALKDLENQVLAAAAVILPPPTRLTTTMAKCLQALRERGKRTSLTQVKLDTPTYLREYVDQALQDLEKMGLITRIKPPKIKTTYFTLFDRLPTVARHDLEDQDPFHHEWRLPKS